MIIPNDNDVLFGRGFTISAHPGNRHLRDVVQAQKPAFLKAKKKEKRKIARRIVDGIFGLDPPGKFLIEDQNTSAQNEGRGSSDKEGILDKVWIGVETEKAVDKVMHRLREKEKPAPGEDQEFPKIPNVHQSAATFGGNNTSIPTQFENVGITPQVPQAILLQHQPIQQQQVPVVAHNDLNNLMQSIQQFDSNFLQQVVNNQQTAGSGFVGQQQQPIQQVNNVQQKQSLQQMNNLQQINELQRSIQQINNHAVFSPEQIVSNLSMQQGGTQQQQQQNIIRSNTVFSPEQIMSNLSMQQGGTQQQHQQNIIRSDAVFDPQYAGPPALTDQMNQQVQSIHWMNTSQQQQQQLSMQQQGITVTQQSNNSLGNAFRSQKSTSGSPALSDTSMNQKFQQMNSQQKVPPQQQNHNAYYGSSSSQSASVGGQSPVLSGMPFALTSGLSDQSSTGSSSSSQAPSRLSLFALNGCSPPPMQAIHEQGNGNEQIAGPPLAATNFQQASRSPVLQPHGTTMRTLLGALYQEVTINEPASMTNPDNAVARGSDKDFDDIMGSFLYNLTSSDQPHKEQVHRPVNKSPQQQLVRELTLRGWIDMSRPRFLHDAPIPGHLTEELSTYIKSGAIPLAIKLTEYLIQAENGPTPLPLASITCENVSVQLKERGYDVTIKSSPGDIPNFGGKMPRLFALGVILYEVFSQDPLFGVGEETDALLGSSSSASVGRLSLGNIEAGDEGDRPSKRSQRNSTALHSSNNSEIHRESIAKLELLGIPQSLCALVGNILDSAQGDFRGDDAYRSLADVCTDLHLMRDDPSRFLDNLHIGPNPSFEIRSKFYGREEEISNVEKSYQQHMNGGCGGIIVSGGAGVGKSSLVSNVTRRLCQETNSYYLDAKFDQNNDVNPLSTIGAVFNTLCDLFARDATQAQLSAVAEALESTLGSQAALLVGVLPSLKKLINFSTNGASTECINQSASMQFLFRKLLETLSQHRRMTFFLDDLQWADPASLLLIASMISTTKEISSYAFFACCYRDDDVQEGDSFTLWLSSINVFPLNVMKKFSNISTEGVNELVSETLHLSPRITRPLSSILHHKTRGNPLFLRQLLELLRDEGYIYPNFNPPRWAWDLNKIEILEISDNVVLLLIKEMQRLQPNLQLALKVAAGIGCTVQYSIFDILSQDLGVNLRDLLSQVVQKGYMVHVDENRIRFAHDKIQQGAYEMTPEQQRLENHMRFGLAICSHALNDAGVENDDLFFVAVNQINRGGPNILTDPNQKVMIAALDLKAGNRSIELSDCSTALKLFEHGISFLDTDERWTTHYSVSLELFDAAVETACALNNAGAVRNLSQQLLAAAKSNDDKLKCLYAVVKSLRMAFKFVDSKKVAFTVLEQLGESLPRPSDDVGLVTNIQEMKHILESISDDSILNFKETNQQKRDILLLNVYHDLNFLFQFVDTPRIADTSLRMIQITLSNGLCCMSPLALAQFAIILVNNEDYALGYRLGNLALKLLDKINAQRYTSAVIALVGCLVSWVAEPVQSVAESHLLGYKLGQRNGDVVASSLNYQFYLQVYFFTGPSLAISRDKSREFALQLVQRKQKFLLNGAASLYLQTVAFTKGLGIKEEGNGVEKLPSWDGLAKSGTGSHQDFSLVFSTHQYMRAFLFQQYDDLPQDGLLDRIFEKNVPLRVIFHYGVFYEGLVSFHFARQTDGNEYHRKGESALKFFRGLYKRNKWNFENKYLTLEAEMMNVSGYHDQASQLYEDAIKSAHDHKFVHEEAVASELAGMHSYDIGLHQKSLSFFMHSIKCYKKWGALAIAQRVEGILQNKFGSGFAQLGTGDDFLASILAPKGGSSKKR